LQVAVYNNDHATHGSDDRSDGQTTSTPRPADKALTVMLKGRNVDEIHNSSNHTTTQSVSGVLVGDSKLHSAVQPAGSTGNSGSSAGCMY